MVKKMCMVLTFCIPTGVSADTAFFSRLLDVCDPLSGREKNNCIIAAQAVKNEFRDDGWSMYEVVRNSSVECLRLAIKSKAPDGSTLPVPALAQSCVGGVILTFQTFYIFSGLREECMIDLSTCVAR